MDTKGPRKAADKVTRYVALSAFDRTDVGSMNFGPVGERLLRQSDPISQSSQVRGDEPSTVNWLALGG